MYKKLRLLEADDEEQDIRDDLEAAEDIEDIIDSEEDQEENPIEERSELDIQLDELREILIDLDLNLYQITDKENENNVFYIIGKVSDVNNNVLMLVDGKPEEVNSEEIPDEEPIINNVDIDDELEESEEPAPRKLTRAEFNKEFGSGANPDVINAGREPEDRIEIIEEDDNLENNEEDEEEHKSELEKRFDFVNLPKSLSEINKLNPRYGDELTPDHDAVMEYLMNCLIEVNPEAAEELQNGEENIEPLEDLPSDDLENINMEEVEDEDEY